MDGGATRVSVLRTVEEERENIEEKRKWFEQGRREGIGNPWVFWSFCTYIG
uniref:Uncharacterized protein n=1 Tax=Medicago truncatula TaxID=3880 RepID=A2Q501_MEDTR|nr:hypothetical protein MtrDRAFT_AC158497g2v2 [Medicago truncatula]